MRKLSLRNYPSQEFNVRIDRHKLTMRWMYNTINDRWSLSVWVDDEKIPRMAGKRVLPSLNLFDGYPLIDIGYELWVVVKPSDRTRNWYERLARPPFDNAIIVLLTPKEREQIIAEQVS